VSRKPSCGLLSEAMVPQSQNGQKTGYRIPEVGMRLSLLEQKCPSESDLGNATNHLLKKLELLWHGLLSRNHIQMNSP
jgi:hypothetical protein